MNALAIAIAQIIVNGGGEHQVLRIFAALHITDVRYLFLWNELYDSYGCQMLQRLVDLLFGKGTFLGDEGFVDVAIVSKESAVVA